MLLFHEAENNLEQQSFRETLPQLSCRWTQLINDRIKINKSHYVRDLQDGLLHSTYASCLWKIGKIEKKLRRRNGKWERCFLHYFESEGIVYYELKLIFSNNSISYSRLEI
jgi:hypothetical protein